MEIRSKMETPQTSESDSGEDEEEQEASTASGEVCLLLAENVRVEDGCVLGGLTVPFAHSVLVTCYDGSTLSGRPVIHLNDIFFCLTHYKKNVIKLC